MTEVERLRDQLNTLLEKVRDLEAWKNSAETQTASVTPSTHAHPDASSGQEITTTQHTAVKALAKGMEKLSYDLKAETTSIEAQITAVTPGPTPQTQPDPSSGQDITASQHTAVKALAKDMGKLSSEQALVSSSEYCFSMAPSLSTHAALSNEPDGPQLNMILHTPAHMDLNMQTDAYNIDLGSFTFTTGSLTFTTGSFTLELRSTSHTVYDPGGTTK